MQHRRVGFAQSFQPWFEFQQPAHSAPTPIERAQACSWKGTAQAEAPCTGELDERQAIGGWITSEAAS